MTRPCHVDAVRRSALSWLNRLGWNYLLPHEAALLRGEYERPVLNDRLRPALQRFKFAWKGRHIPLSEGAIQRILRQANAFHSTSDRARSSADALVLVLEGVASTIDLPDGSVAPVIVPLVDWEHPNRNHWDVADDLLRSGISRDPGIRDLACYVNGLPLALIACVERDAQGQWGCLASGIRHLMRITGPYCGDRAPDHAQLLICLGRGGGLYGGFASPAEAWSRWREQIISPAALLELRVQDVRPCKGPPDAPLGTHAELLCGLLQPARLAEFLRGYCSGAGRRPWRIARAAQFFACQQALQHLRRVARYRKPGDGQVCLAPGAGLRYTREWLASAIAREPALQRLRVLLLVTDARPAHLYTATTAGEVQQRLDDAFAAPLALTVQTLQEWIADPACEAPPEVNVVVLVDAGFWTQPPRVVTALRSGLPHASWLTFGSIPMALDGAGSTSPVLYQYPRDAAIADGAVLPVWHTRHPADQVPGDARTACIVATIQQHLWRNLRLTGGDLRAELLVSSLDCARRYQQAFEREGQLLTVLKGVDAQGRPLGPPSRFPLLAADLVISAGAIPHAPDRRLTVLYIDRDITDSDLARAIGRINQPGSDKHHAFVVDFRALASVPDSRWHPAALASSHLLVERLRCRLGALLPVPVGIDFPACRESLAPRWALNAYAGDRDLHRRRRHLLQRRYTQWGLAAQAAVSAADDLAGSDAHGVRQADMQMYSLLRDVVSQDALEQDGFSRDDLQVRQWARQLAPDVREQRAAYDLSPPEDDETASPLRRADLLYTRLHQRLEHPADEPGLQELARSQLRRVLADHAEPCARLAALRALEARIPALLGGVPLHPPSRGRLLVKGVLGNGFGDEVVMRLGARVDEVVASGRGLAADRMDQFQAHLRLHLQPQLDQDVGEEAALHILDALYTRAPHWPPMASPAAHR